VRKGLKGAGRLLYLLYISRKRKEKTSDGEEVQRKRAQEEKRIRNAVIYMTAFLFLIQQTLPFPLLASQVQAGSAPANPMIL